jgi:hypothetical protein
VYDAISGWTTDADREMPGMGIVCLTTASVIAALPSTRTSASPTAD